MSVEPVYFGQRNLFGLYRPAQMSPTVRKHLLVICNATFHEYFKTQFVARQLGKELAAIGYDVLRFDYTGQGNSEGELDSLHWPSNIRAAVDEGLAISGAASTSMIGFRVGALLAANSDVPLRSLVMWDPVMDGKTYIDELRQVQHRLVTAHHYMDEQSRQEIVANELVGHHVGQGLVDDLGSLNIDLQGTVAERICVISSSDDRKVRNTARNDNVRLISEPFHCQWDLPSSRLLFAHDVVNRIVELFR